MYQFSGGAHGTTLEHGLTFDSDTGHPYTLQELFKPNSNYKKLINNNIKAQLQKRNLTEDLFKPFDTIPDDVQFYVADKTLVIFFNQYDILPYVFGITYFPIPLYALQEAIPDDGPLSRLL